MSRKWAALMILFVICMQAVSCSAYENDISSKMPVSHANDYDNNAEISTAIDELYNNYLVNIAGRNSELSEGKISVNGQTMRVNMEIIGEPDANGYPLYIGLRGGGVEDDKAAEQQFEAMQDYYKRGIESGIYIVPQPLKACWDEHYRPESFLFYDHIIEDAIAFYNADPNRVYLLGFSSGGDGVYAISPRYADRFAAVNMSAGYPHVLRIGNMYNLPVCIQVGEKDSSYERNVKAAEYDELLNSCHEKYGGGYEHETFIHVNGTHNNWDDIYNTEQDVYTGEDVSRWLHTPSEAKVTIRSTGAVQWVSQYTRDPLPQKLVWEPYINAGLRRSQSFYWLDRDGDFPDTVVVASYNKAENRISINNCNAHKGTLKIYLNPQMVDVFKDVTIEYDGYEKKIRPVVSNQIMKSTLEARGDRNYIFTSEIDLKFDTSGTPAIDAVAESKTSYEADQDNLIYWNSEGLFYVDNSLFDLTFSELEQKLGYKLPKPEKWEYWGEDLYWTYKEFEDIGKTVVFMFQNNKTGIIYSEEDGEVSANLSDAAVNCFGETSNAFVNGGLCRYFLENNYYDGKDHIRQMYVYYKCKY